MAGSYLARHRPICTVLQEIKERVAQMVATDNLQDDNGITTLCDEAIDYAQRMSAKLREYKDAKSGKA